ncbi:hypothetical protein [Micromonospora sp. WMMD812]|nr:hypothetical protein [Micromonospora sp. WMMD812]WBB67332.1 hypothetical protein O7603_30275 [Micromonospora sp. WMMD812]
MAWRSDGPAETAVAAAERALSVGGLAGCPPPRGGGHPVLSG